MGGNGVGATLENVPQVYRLRRQQLNSEKQLTADTQNKHYEDICLEFRSTYLNRPAFRKLPHALLLVRVPYLPYAAFGLLQEQFAGVQHLP
ncbi:hypothetical protein CSE6_028_43640 [Comamonas sp. E6]|nr:hypothetical protein CSE6_028_43640 [Comamonas sp. E6]